MAYRSRYFGGGFIHVVPPSMVLPHWWGEGVAGRPGPIEGASKRAANRRRYERRKANTVGARYSLAEVAERDGFVCHLCGCDVDMGLPGRHPLGPSADHVVPVSCGGGDEPENIKLSHLRCNVKRGARMLA